jgi:hypothetical protein
VTSPLAPYPSPAERRRRVDRLADTVGERVVFGHSVDGEPLVAVRVPCSTPGHDAPRVLCCANIHGLEYVGGLVALGLLESMQDGPGARLRAEAELWVVPCLNPDGYRVTFEREGDAPVRALRPNAHGVDLNRNYPLPPGERRWPLPGAGSPDPQAATYRGPHALSEPETTALDVLARDQRFHASLNLHSFMGTLIPARVTDRGCYATYRELAQTFAAAQPRVRYRRLANRVLDTFTGEQEDHQHHALDAWACCVEVFDWASSLRQHVRAPTSFWRFNPRDPAPWIDNDVPAICAWLTAALGRPRPSALSPRA